MELFKPEVAVENLGPLLAGLLMTVELTFVVIVLSLVFALLVALGGMSRWPLLRWPVKTYIEIIRGTPLLLQLIYIYYVLPEIGIRLERLHRRRDRPDAELLGLYLRGLSRRHPGDRAKGQHDAAAALGMTRVLAMRRIILPQAIRIVIPTLGNYFISLFKDTALCSVVSIQEVLFTAQIIAARNFQYFTLYTVVGGMYFAVSFPAARLVGWLERVTRSGYRRKRA